MSYVNKYTESATYSGGSLIFSLNDGLTYSVNIPSSDTPSLSEVLSVGNDSSSYDIIMGTSTSIKSNSILRLNTNVDNSYIELDNITPIMNLYSTKDVNITADNGTINTIGNIVMSSGTITVNNTYTLPLDGGSSNQVLTTNGAGQASWATASSLLSSRLTAWDAYNTNGLVAQTSATTWTNRTIVGPASGITITNGNGVSGNPTLTLANDLSALEGLGSTGFAVRTATDTWSNRTITSGGNPITITNGNGVSGNPTIGFNGTYIGTFTASTGLVTSGNITACDFIQNSSDSIQTTNNTITTLKTIPTTSGTIYHIEVTVIAGLATTANGYTMKMFLSYKNNGGTLTQIGSGNFFQDSDWTGPRPVTIPAISGTNILIQVGGLPLTTIDWYGYVTVRSAPMGVI